MKTNRKPTSAIRENLLWECNQSQIGKIGKGGFTSHLCTKLKIILNFDNGIATKFRQILVTTGLTLAMAIFQNTT
jgi:hypothetical protein